MLFHKAPAIIVWISMMAFSPAKSRILALRANNNIIMPRHCHTFLRSPLWNNDRNQPLKIPSCRRQYSSALFGTASSPSSSSLSSATMTLELPTPDDTEEVAAVLASILLEPYYDKAPPDQYTEDRSNVKGTMLLGGDLGAGKTAFARGFLRAATGEDGLRVTSPTYLLVNVYPIIGGSLEYELCLSCHVSYYFANYYSTHTILFCWLRYCRIHHMDLYRLSGNPEDLLPLNLKHVFENCTYLIIR